MSTSHLPHAALSRHGIHLVARSQTMMKSPLITPNRAYKFAAASAALLLLMTVC